MIQQSSHWVWLDNERSISQDERVEDRHHMVVVGIEESRYLLLSDILSQCTLQSLLDGIIPDVLDQWTMV